MSETPAGPIVDFLRARYDEIETRIAKLRKAHYDIDGEALDVLTVTDFLNADELLADIAAKRKILAAYAERDDREDYVTIGDWTSCSDSCPVELLERVLRILAAPFRAHADFDPTWTVDP